MSNIQLPTTATLRKYGLDLNEWLSYLPVRDIPTGEDENGDYIIEAERFCPVCESVPPTGRFVIDHQHVRGWKQMPPWERKKYVRGVVCTTCNHFVLTRYGTPTKLRNAAVYLEQYERRRGLDP